MRPRCAGPGGAGALGLALALTLGLSACGGASGSGAVAVRIGQTEITQATVAHWVSVMAGGRAPSADSQRYELLRQRALSYLISSQWLIGEAAQRGVVLSEGEVGRRLHEKEASFPNGPAEFKQFLGAAGRSRSDVGLELEDELASAKLREDLVQREPKVTTAEVANYYRWHMRRFEHSEERYFYIVENIETKIAASKLMAEIVRGKKRIAKAGATFYEHLARPRDMRRARTIVKAIFAITPHVVSHPIRVELFYFLIKVTKVVPAHVQTFAQARAAIEGKIASERRRRTLASFIGDWRRRWTARTACRPGYVVQKCRQYAGAMAPEEPLSFT